MPRTLMGDDDLDILAALRLLLENEGYGARNRVFTSRMPEQSNVLNYAGDTTSGREGIDLISRIQAVDPFFQSS